MLAAALGRQQEFEKLGAPDNYDCHLYLVTSRPRQSVLPETVTITDTSVSFTLRLQVGGAFAESQVFGSHELGPGPWRWESKWPYEEFSIVNSTTGEVPMSAVVALLGIGLEDERWPRAALRHDVLYVGQAFGRDGERTAWDRLKNHSTLQRILAESPPDRQVWLSLAAITDVHGAQLMSPHPATASAEDELERNTRIAMAVANDAVFRARDSVALAEAGLIRFFQPPYNRYLRDSFPAPRQVPLETARTFDFHGLIVELQGQEIHALFGSESVEHRELHFGYFTIHADKNRADPFEFLLPALPSD